MNNKILLIGGKGLVGSSLNLYLSKFYNVTICGRNDNFNDLKNKFETIIHAANSSKKFESFKSPEIDYRESVSKTNKILKSFSNERIILISSISSRIENNTYGKNRKLCEELVLKHNSKNLIIRLPVLHSEMSNRGIIYDILKSRKIYLDKETRINPISIDQFSQFFIENFEKFTDVIEFGSKQDTNIGELIKLINSKSECKGLKLNLTSSKKIEDLPDLENFLSYFKKLSL